MDDLELFIDLDLDHIEKGFKNLDKLADKIEDAIQDGIAELIEKTKSKLIWYMQSYGLGDSGLIDKIRIEEYDEGIYITVDSKYAVFVEYGTGYNGSGDPHPKASEEGWIYMSGKNSGRGVGGWFYPTIESDPNPYKHTYNGKLYGWTQGLPSRPFMYMTHKWAKTQVTRIIRKHIRGIKLDS